MCLLMEISYQTVHSGGLSLSHSNGKLKYWSQLDNILPIYFTGVTSLSSVTTSKKIYKSIQQIETSTEVHQHILNFLSEQLTLLFFHPKDRRYSIDMLICVFACLDRGGLIIYLICVLILFNVHTVSLICVCLPVWSLYLSKLTIKNKH